MKNTLAPLNVSALGLPKTYSAMLAKYRSARGALTLEGVTGYLAELATHARPSTVRVTKYALQASLLAEVHDARAQEVIRAAFRRIKTARPDKTIHQETILTADQVRSLTEADASPRARLLVKVLSATGTRLSECLGMRKGDCTIASEAVSVRIIGKGRKERRVFLPVALYAEVLSTFAGKVFLFETENGKAIHASAGRRMVYSVARAAGVKGVHPHSFRHAFATNQLKAGRTLKAVSQYLGHSTVAVTSLFYDHTELTPAEALGVAS